MKIKHMALLTILICFFLLIRSAYADMYEDSLVDVLVSIPADEAALGSAVPVEVIITPVQPITDMQVSLSNNTLWVWVQEFQIPSVITHTTVLNSWISPQSIGELPLSILVDYTAGGQSFREYIDTGDILQVKPVEEFVSLTITTDRGTVSSGDDVEFFISINNRSPFTLTVDQIEGVGIDLEWYPYSGSQQIDPGAHTLSISAEVIGQHPQPQLSMTYSWNDVQGRAASNTNTVVGSEINYDAGFDLLKKIPVEIWGIIVGLLAGSLSLLANDWVTRTINRGENCRQVSGLLQMVIMEVDHAAKDGTEIRVNPLEKLIEEAHLYQVLAHFDLVKDVRHLWDQASKHNRSLNTPGNVQREKELRNAADVLNKNIDRISSGWIAYAWEKRFGKGKKSPDKSSAVAQPPLSDRPSKKQ